MKIVLSTLLAMIGISVAPRTFEEKLAEQSSKQFMDCICCLPDQSRIVQVPAQSHQRIQQAPTLSPPLPQQAMPPASPEIVQQQQPLTVPQQQIDLNAMMAQQLMQPQAVPVQLVAFGRREGGCGGGGEGYYNYRHRRFGGRLRRG